MPAADSERLAFYADCFNAHRFDDLRDRLAAEVRLDLVSRDKRTGPERVGGYFSNYQKQSDWFMVPGSVENRPAILAYDRADQASPPRYFILLEFFGEQVGKIQDFRYAGYGMDDVRWERV